MEDKKAQIIHSAIQLFQAKGYAGTSVRDIATKAEMNVSLISYYFNNKDGLLRNIFLLYFEKYFQTIEETVFKHSDKEDSEFIYEYIHAILSFHATEHVLSRFVLREMATDTQLVRELTATYLMKERQYFISLFHKIPLQDTPAIPDRFLLLQFKSMLIMPFLHAQYAREVWQLFPNEPYFVDRHTQVIMQWVTKTWSLPPKQRLKVAY